MVHEEAIQDIHVGILEKDRTHTSNKSRVTRSVITNAFWGHGEHSNPCTKGGMANHRATPRTSTMKAETHGSCTPQRWLVSSGHVTESKIAIACTSSLEEAHIQLNQALHTRLQIASCQVQRRCVTWPPLGNGNHEDRLSRGIRNREAPIVNHHDSPPCYLRSMALLRRPKATILACNLHR